MKHAATRPAGGRRKAARVRPRYGRITAFGAAVTVTTLAVLGGFGMLPADEGGPEAASASTSVADRTVPELSRNDARAATATPGLLDAAGSPIAAFSESTELPAGSGTGRRIVFSESRQRVWLVDGSGRVEQTYLVSGSVTDNLQPGTYRVFSRSRHAIGVDDSGTMEYFVRFTHGTEGAAIGFHTIPRDHGRPVQTIAQLGTPRSHGCIRQRLSHAIALWEFAPVGTTVVVTG